MPDDLTRGDTRDDSRDQSRDDCSAAGILVVAEICESPRQPGRYAATLSDGRRFAVGATALAELGLTRRGAPVTPGVLTRLEREAAIADVQVRAVNALARARRTRRELELRLRRVNPDRTVVGEALDRLEQQGLLSDSDAANAEAVSRLRRGDGPARVRELLRRKGVDSRTADAALESALNDQEFDEHAECRRLAERRYSTLASLDQEVARRRLGAFLIRRGYAAGVVRQVVRDVIQRRPRP